MAYFYTSQHQQWIPPQESAAYGPGQQEHQYPQQYQQQYIEVPSNVLRTSQQQQWTSQDAAYGQQHHQYFQQYQQQYIETPSSNVFRPNMASHQPSFPVSSYSSLSDAMDLSNMTSSTPRKKSAGTRTSATPYPVAHHDVSNTHSHGQGRSRSHSQTQALASASRNTRQCTSQELLQAQRLPVRAHAPPPSGPTNHVLIPQEEYFDERDKKWRYGPRFPPITFKTVNIPELGVRVGKVAHSPDPPAIDEPNEEIFKVAGDREVQLWLLWPGYSSEPLKKRIKTQGGKLTRELLLTIIAHAILDFTFDIHRKKIPIERGYENWEIGSKAQGKGIIGGELFITRIVHRGGSNWQVEIWTPKKY